MNALDKLKQYTRVVADTGDFESMKQFKPQDATTNPSLIYAAAKSKKYDHLIDQAIAEARGDSPEEKLANCLDILAVKFGLEILKIVPGRVSTEVDARLSFDTEGTINKAHQLIDMYEKAGIGRERILIKIASTWEGIQAAEVLEKENIHCNLTLLFSKIQAIACAEANVKLISPFVGRILDWYKNHRGVDHIDPVDDPGVLSVTEIFTYYKKFGYPTEVMGASFRNAGEIIELAGCDLLTIAPSLLGELEKMDGDAIQVKLDAKKAAHFNIEKTPADEKHFRWYMNEDAMATEKLADGIRRFTADLISLEDFIREKL